MARKPMVTRTIITTKVNVLCMDVVKCEPFNKEVLLPRTFADEKKLMKAVEEAVNVDNIKAVHVVDVDTVETLYGMSEADFIAIAVELDPTTRKPLNGSIIEEEEALDVEPIEAIEAIDGDSIEEEDTEE